ncbi:MAG: hypothetical protein JNJ54_27685 [Myxococcaceae bacterium]|nr:hypothetical protein [Myxococcaceae bacterium]
MLALVVQLALSQGPGSTLEVQQPTAPQPSSVTTSEPNSGLELRKLEGSAVSSIELKDVDALIRKVSLVEGRAAPCEHLATQAFCDDPTIVKPELSYTLSDGGVSNVQLFTFIGLKPGRTTCACGQPRNLQLVYEFTVGSLEDALRPVARKVVGAAFARLYTQRRSLVP